MLTPSEQREIMRQDRRRRRQREQAEAIELWLRQNPQTDLNTTSRFKHATPELVRGIGVVCPPLKPKSCNTKTRDQWLHRPHTVGFAPGSDPTIQTVRVIRADGTDNIVPIGTIRPPRSAKAPQSTKSAPIRQHRIMAADLKPIQADVD